MVTKLLFVLLGMVTGGALFALYVIWYFNKHNPS